MKKWGAKLGLRVENTDLSTLLTNTNEANNQNFTNFFPTVHSSYKFTENISVCKRATPGVSIAPGCGT